MTRNQKIFLCSALLGAVVVFFGLDYFASNETKIRRVLDDTVEAINDGLAGDAVDGLAEDFREERSGADRRTIQQYLLGTFLSKQNRHEKRFRYPVEIDESSLEIDISESEEQARVAFSIFVRDARINSTSTEGGDSLADDSPIWEADVELDFALIDGDWLVRRCRYTGTNGRRPF